ncbi:PREDICTED: uncharacterized protein DKFZp434B061-like [Branchiostoma belcheri]|uniref:Uncharacterized protein DKFZp434B061-like n=1 Tax=Branchiostoma belcheri TaxID=7741 RepID=A0A6P4ZYT7_BRABE|nr:PREDICTED: uncharacterized protein DKFZp434B061-like [Branchiostoma belcheri]
MRVLYLLVLLVPTCVLAQSFLQRALSDLAQGGRKVCPYCPYCAYASRCGGRCTRPECAACGYRFHCSSTCVTLCLQPETTTPRSTTTTTTTTEATTPPTSTTQEPTTTLPVSTSPGPSTSPNPSTAPPSSSPDPSASPSSPPDPSASPSSPPDPTAASPTPPDEDSGCEERGGYCEERDYSCPGRYVFHGGLCADRPGRVCCLPHEEPLCREKGGVCRSDARSCPRGYHEGGGSCTGPSNKNKRCCLPDPTTPAATTQMPSTTKPASTPPATTTPKATPPPPSKCSKLKMVSRGGWGARPPKKRTLFANPPSRVVIHHSDGYLRHLFSWSYSSVADYRERVQDIQEGHFDRGFDDIGYNFLIDGFGNVYEGRGWDYSGAHVPCCNSFALGINFLGYFDSRTPTAAAREAGENLIACGVEMGKIRQGYDLKCHLDLGAASGDTDCPGAALCRYARRHYSGL